MADLGVSFSLHRCREFDLTPRTLLKAALEDLGFRRFRLMSYWNIHEPQPGQYDFSELDWQLDLIAQYGGEVTLCLGKRQPRWPECHMPEWAAALPAAEWYRALYDYIGTVVRRYREHPALISWQLENEALLKTFGYCPDKDYSHRRLRQEAALVRRLDRTHPLVMTLSDSWGLPWRRPQPDVYAMSLYRNTINQQGRYTASQRSPGFYRSRALLIRLYTGRPTFIHELQAEPWLDRSITDIPIEQQLQRLDAAKLAENVQFARQTGLKPIDLWGLEWWYWLKVRHGNDSLWDTAQKL
jgi:hypothetical protein